MSEVIDWMIDHIQKVFSDTDFHHKIVTRISAGSTYEPMYLIILEILGHAYKKIRDANPMESCDMILKAG